MKAKSLKARENQLRVIHELGLMEMFRDSKYSSYGWFLRALGIHVTAFSITIKPDSPFFDCPQALALEVNINE